MPSANKHFIWVKLDAVNLGTDKDIYVCCLYLPPSNSEYLKTQDIDIFYLLRSDIIKYSTRGNLILIGDFNSRLGNYQETLTFINNENEQEPDQKFERVELPHRSFQVTEKNTSGRKLIQLLNESNLISLNGRKIGDTSGKFTCHQYNGSSTVDLGVVSWELYDKVQYFKVLQPLRFSDHCPVKIYLEIGSLVEEGKINFDEFVDLEQTFEWSENSSAEFSKIL